MTPTPRSEGFHGEFLWELEIAARQLTGLAEAIPADKYDWRPDAKIRSVGEVLVHVAAGNFMLLDFAGIPAPADLYGELPAAGRDRLKQIVRTNDDLEQTLRDKQAILRLLHRSLNLAANSFAEAGQTELDRTLHFFGETTSVRRVYLRLLAHNHEHMGQMVAYARINGTAPPWPDWRPDRRPK